MTTREKINDLVKKRDNARTSEQKRNLQILIDNQKAFLKNNNQGLKKPQAMTKYYDVVYQTTSGRLMIAKRVSAKSETEAKEKVKNEMRASTTFKEIKMAIGLGAPATKGLRTICAQTFSVTGLRRKDGTQKKGFVAKKGGKLVKKTAKKPVAKKATTK